ncbi:MAG: NAD(P)-dependent oxidoreductase [bacterium]
MRIAFFDIQPCEKEIITAKFKKGQVKYFEQTINKVNLKQLKDVEVVSVFVYSKVDNKIISQLPKLKMIACRSTGFDHIDLAFCKKKGIVVCNVPSYGENTVAEHAFMLLLAIIKKLPETLSKTNKKKYDLKGLRGLDLHGKTIGIIGAGRIGKNAIKIAKGFGLDVLATDINRDTLLAEVLNFKYVSLSTLLKNSDIITLHAPYNPSTHHLLNMKNIKKIKPGAILINTARGGLIETEALLYGLNNNILGAVGLDVLEEENLIIKNKLTAEQKKNPILLANQKIIAKPNVLFTPHNAFNTDEAIDRITNTTIDNIIGFYKKDLENVVKAKK